MDKAEFDRFAEEYYDLLAKNIGFSGESPDFFSQYKIQEVEKAARRLGLRKDARILDFGSGVGNSVPYFARYFPDAELTCIDVSAKSLEVSKGRFPDLAEYKLFDGHSLPFADGTFDIIFTACVFHHIPEIEHHRLFQELHRVLKKSGIFVVFEHNPLNPLTVRVVNKCPFDENAVLISARKLKSRLKSAGFKDVATGYCLFFPAFASKLRFLEHFMRWLPLGAQYHSIAQK